MDPSLDSDDEDNSAMAAMLGFSGFGSQKPPTKRRKFNASTDAFVEGQELSALDKGGKKGQGSGGNTMPLGKMRVLGTKAGGQAENVVPVRAGVRNEEEIDLEEDDDDDEGEGGDGPQYLDTSRPPPAEEEEGPVYVDTSRPPPISEDEARETQARIDALLASIAPEGPPNSSIDETPPTYGQNVRPDVGAGMGRGGMRGGYSDTTSKTRPHQRGRRNENWYIGYYDPSFNENPWERLEKARGLQAVGSWLERGGTGS